MLGFGRRAAIPSYMLKYSRALVSLEQVKFGIADHRLPASDLLLSDRDELLRGTGGLA